MAQTPYGWIRKLDELETRPARRFEAKFGSGVTLEDHLAGLTLVSVRNPTEKSPVITLLKAIAVALTVSPEQTPGVHFHPWRWCSPY